MAVVTLPNGVTLHTPNHREALFLYREIFEDRGYLRHGLEVRDGDCVFDVGANVGLFSAALAEQYRSLRLVLFEPIPGTFAMLERNAEQLLRDARVTLVCAGVSVAAGRAPFEVDPAWSICAGAVPFLREIEAGSRSARRAAGARAWNAAALADAERLGFMSAAGARRLAAALDNRLLRPWACGALRVLFTLVALKRRRTLTRVECDLTTVSRAMREHGIERIDLLKVDAEGAEWSVLQGVDAVDWPRIRQLVLEVHGEEPADRIRAFLEDKGYDVAVERDGWLLPRLMGFRMLYARRTTP